MVAIDPMKLLQQYWKWLALVCIVSVGLGVGVYLGLRIVMPRYESVATFEVFPPRTGVGDFGVEALADGGEQEMESYMETQVFVMGSEKILRRVVEQREVQETSWARPYQTPTGFDVVEAYDKIKDVVSARRIANTQIIVLRARTRNRDDALVVADVASSVYMDDVRDREKGYSLDQKRDLERQLNELRASIDGIDAEIETLLQRNRITSLEQAGSSQLLEVRELRPLLAETNSDLAELRSLRDVYETMLNEPGGAVFPEAIRAEVESTPIIVNLDADISNLKAQIRMFRERGTAHRDVKDLESRLGALQAERDDLVNERLLATFTARIEAFDDQIATQEASAADTQGRLEQAEQRLNDITRVLKQHDDLQAERTRLLVAVDETDRYLRDVQAVINSPIRVRELDRARRPDQLAFPKPIPVIGLIAVFVPGLFAGLIVLREMREQRVRGPQDVAIIPRTRVLGVIPDESMDPSRPDVLETASRDAPGGVIAECIRQVRTSLLKDCSSMNLKSVLVFGGMPESGTTTFLTNLALSLSETGARVLVIDANVRRPKVAEILGGQNEPGLTDVLAGRIPLAEAIQSGDDDTSPSILPAGSRDAKVYERFSSETTGELFEDARQRYDIVLVDAPPAVVASDALALAQHCDASILVVKAYLEKRGLVSRLRHQFADARAEFMGVIVNGVKPSAGGYFKRNFQVTHEYGREAKGASRIEAEPARDPSTNGTADHID